jgi:hypothetical protein
LGYVGDFRRGNDKNNDEEETMPITIECAIEKMTNTVEEKQTMA